MTSTTESQPGTGAARAADVILAALGACPLQSLPPDERRLARLAN